MKLYQSSSDAESVELDSIDLGILDLLQGNCKQSLAQIGERVGLKAPSVLERIHKLEEAGVVMGYSALLDARLALGAHHRRRSPLHEQVVGARPADRLRAYVHSPGG